MTPETLCRQGAAILMCLWKVRVTQRELRTQPGIGELPYVTHFRLHVKEHVESKNPFPYFS